MNGWKKICCAIDFSESSRLALEQAAELAGGVGAELTLVHVHTPPSHAAVDVLTGAPEGASVAARELEKLLTGWRADAERVSGRAARIALLSGDPAEQIVRFARESGSDLVVVGTHGRRGLRRLVLGSVAERVLRAAPCPVLAARPTEGRPTEEEALREEIAQYR
jgi:nucleotide-binding universal stress UspA family protein